MNIPLLARGRAQRASSADFSSRSKHLFHFPSTPVFRNPLPHPARVAVLRLKLSGNNLRVFQPSQAALIQTFRPGILAGTLSALRRLSAPVPVAKAIVVFSETKFPQIADQDRDWLWKKFEVPSFQQILDRHGHVIAEECQVHCGLHVIRPEAIAGMLTSAECDCGRTEPRLASPLMR